MAAGHVSEHDLFLSTLAMISTLQYKPSPLELTAIKKFRRDFPACLRLVEFDRKLRRLVVFPSESCDKRQQYGNNFEELII